MGSIDGIASKYRGRRATRPYSEDDKVLSQKNGNWIERNEDDVYGTTGPGGQCDSGAVLRPEGEGITEGLELYRAGGAASNIRDGEGERRGRRVVEDDPEVVACRSDAQDCGRGTEESRRTFAGQLERVAQLYKWGDVAEAEYVAERNRLRCALELLGPDDAPRSVSDAALKLAETIGVAWQHASQESRRAFLTECFSEIRLHANGAIDVVARDAVREIVYAAAPNVVGTVGSTGLEPVERHHSRYGLISPKPGRMNHANPATQSPVGNCRDGRTGNPRSTNSRGRNSRRGLPGGDDCRA